MYKIQERVDTKEKLVSALKTIPQVNLLNESEFLNEKDFTKEYCRALKINVNENLYIIVWYHNYCSLVSDHVECNFDSITLNSPTYPTVMGSKCKLQLIKDDNIVCVIG